MTEPFRWTTKNQEIPKEIQDWMDEEREKFAEEIYSILLVGYGLQT